MEKPTHDHRQRLTKIVFIACIHGSAYAPRRGVLHAPDHPHSVTSHPNLHIHIDPWALTCVVFCMQVMPYSTACCTPLSNFEAGLNYKDVSDPAIMVAFPLEGDPDAASMVAWTTTPWFDPPCTY
jgi:hypothetical protein